MAELLTHADLPSLAGATGWLNSPPLTTAGLRGRVVVADFWTYTCINWIRTLPYVRAWSRKYADQGLAVVGIHTPEFPFEQQPENVSRAAREMRVEYPIALDPEYAVWKAFDNHYWPALYIADARGRIRHHQFGEGGYDDCERIIQALLREAGHDQIGDDLVSVDPEGIEAGADWSTLASPETYLGYDQGDNFAPGGRLEFDKPHTYSIPDSLQLNSWGLSGEWTIAAGAAVLQQARGRIAFRFRARDVNLVMAPPAGRTVPFRVLVDGRAPGDAHGADTNELGGGSLTEPRLYQLVRETRAPSERTFEISFDDPGAEAYVFTFG